MDFDPTFAGAFSSNEPHLLTQGNLNDIVRDLNLSKSKLNFQAPGQRDLLRQNTKVCLYRGCHKEFKNFVFQEDGVVFCNDV